MSRVRVIGVLLACWAALTVPAPAVAVGGPPPDAHQQLRQILDRPLYKAWRLRQDPADPGNPPAAGDWPWLRRMTRSVGDFFDWLFGNRSTPTPHLVTAGNALPAVLKLAAWVVVVLGLTALAIMVLRSLTKAAAAGPVARVLSRQQIHTAMESGDALALGVDGWMSEADRLAAEQNFRAVYRALYLALLSGLHAAGKIEHSLARTNWSYVSRYRGPAEERQTFSDLTGVFDRVWYGRRTTDGDDLSTLQRQVASLTRAGTVA